MAKPNFTPGLGGLSTNRYDFESHIEGFAFRHNAIQIDVNPAVVIAGIPYITVADALYALGNFVTQTELNGAGFVAVGDGYDTYHNANGNPNYDSTIPSLDTLLNPLFTYLINYYNNPNATTLAAIPQQYLRVKDGGVILIKAGTYTIANTVIVPPGFILMGEGFGTKIVNITSPSAPLFSVMPDNSFLNGIRQTDLGVLAGNIGLQNDLFMFARDTVFYNMVIGDNFIEPIQAGDSTYLLPQNLPVYSTITNATAASPIEITTSSAHGLLTGTTVVVAGVGGVSGANGTFIITAVDATHFTLNNTNGSGSYTSGGTVYGNPSPLISQQEGASIIIDRVKFVGKIELSAGKPSRVSGAAIGTNSTLSYLSGTSLSITNSIFDGFTVPINFTASGNVNDYLLCMDNKIRSCGTNGSSTNDYGQNFFTGPIQMNTCNAQISDNFVEMIFTNNTAVFLSTSTMGGFSENPGPSLVSIVNINFPYYLITNASDASPIEITTTTNSLTNGEAITISGVGGNTAANGVFNIAVIDSSHFTLNGTTGNGTYVSNSGSVYPSSTKMNIAINGNNITTINSAGKPTSNSYIITYQPFNFTNGSSPFQLAANSSVITNAINYSVYGNTNNANNNLISPIAYKAVNTGAFSFYSFTGDETVILVPNILEAPFQVNLPQNLTVPGRIITIKNVSTPGVALSSPTILVPWGPNWQVATTSGNGVSPIEITTSLPNNLITNDIITITGVNGNSAANGTFSITVIDSTHFTLSGSPTPTGNGNYSGGGIVYGTDYIEGQQASYSMNSDYQIVRLLSAGDGNWWFI